MFRLIIGLRNRKIIVLQKQHFLESFRVPCFSCKVLITRFFYRTPLHRGVLVEVRLPWIRKHEWKGHVIGSRILHRAQKQRRSVTLTTCTPEWSVHIPFHTDKNNYWNLYLLSKTRLRTIENIFSPTHNFTIVEIVLHKVNTLQLRKYFSENICKYHWSS